MKKIIMFLLILLGPFMALAKEYEVSSIKTKLDISDEYIVLTRENLKDNGNLSELGISKEYIESVMEDSDLYYVITKKDVPFELFIAVPEKQLEFDNLKDVNNEKLNNIKEDIVKKTKSQVLNVYDNKYKFIMVDYFDKETNYYIVNYYTVVNSRGYNFQFQKKIEITDIEKIELKKIIDSVDIETDNNSKDNTPSKDSKAPSDFNYNNIIYAIILGSIAGIVSYIIIVNRDKKKA